MSFTQLPRRTVLAGLGGAAGSALLASCARDGDTPEPAGPPSAGSAALPSYVPFPGLTPDLPASDDGVTAGFFNHPRPPIDRDGFPLPTTDPVTALLQGGAPTTAPDSSPIYQRFREQAGNQLQAATVVSTEYTAKFQVTIAGRDLPDLVQIEPVPRLPEILESNFTDLSDFLSGDAVTRYPALASFTADNWAVSSLNGRIWGVPQPRPPAGRILMTRGDLLVQKGIDTNPTISDGEDFVALLAELTDPSANTFALGGDPAGWLLRVVREMYGAPNIWHQDDDGTFSHEINAPETVEALDQAAKIVQAGYTHPQSFADPGSNNTWFRAGTTPLLVQTFPSWGNYARSNPEFDMGHVRLPQWDGGGNTRIYTSLAGYYGYVAIRQQDSPERVEEILRILDYIASPFGTSQYLDIAYGLEGETYTLDEGEPSFVEGGSDQILVGWPYAGGGAQNVLYAPGNPDLVQRQHDYLSTVLPEGRRDASVGLYSATALGKAATWTKRRNDTERSILLGERPVSAWQEFAQAWTKDVGQAMAEEYQQAAAAS